jgi:hypothetical protein
MGSTFLKHPNYTPVDGQFPDFSGSQSTRKSQQSPGIGAFFRQIFCRILLSAIRVDHTRWTGRRHDAATIPFQPGK